MKDRIVVITSLGLLALLIFFALNFERITGNVINEACVPYSRISFQAFGDENKLGKVSLASGDVNLDGYKDIIVGSGDFGGSEIKAFSVFTKKLLEFKAFEDDENRNGDVYVAAGDIDKDNIDDIIVGSGVFSNSLVRVFDHDGDEILEFQAFADVENPDGKLSIAVFDLDRDGNAEIITGTGIGGRSLINVFDNNGEKIKSFNAFSSQNSGGEVYVAVGDVMGDEKGEIIAGTGIGGTSRIGIFDENGKRIKEFNAIKSKNGNVFVAAGDVLLGDKDEIIAGSGNDGNNIAVYDANGKTIYKITPFNARYNTKGEILVAASNLFGNKKEEIIAGTGMSGSSYVDVTEIKCGVNMECTDADNDGSCYDKDCLDINKDVYPGALEFCDSLDNDCDKIADEHCNQCISVPEICGDSADNDCDGYTDCNDMDCIGLESCF